MTTFDFLGYSFEEPREGELSEQQDMIDGTPCPFCGDYLDEESPGLAMDTEGEGFQVYCQGAVRGECPGVEPSGGSGPTLQAACEAFSATVIEISKGLPSCSKCDSLKVRLNQGVPAAERYFAYAIGSNGQPDGEVALTPRMGRVDRVEARSFYMCHECGSSWNSWVECKADCIGARDGWFDGEGFDFSALVVTDPKGRLAKYGEDCVFSREEWVEQRTRILGQMKAMEASLDDELHRTLTGLLQEYEVLLYMTQRVEGVLRWSDDTGQLSLF